MREHQLQLVDLEDLAVDVSGAMLPHAGGEIRVLCMASSLSKVTDETACPEGRSRRRLALQKPANSAICGSSTMR